MAQLLPRRRRCSLAVFGTDLVSYRRLDGRMSTVAERLLGRGSSHGSESSMGPRVLGQLRRSGARPEPSFRRADGPETSDEAPPHA